MPSRASALKTHPVVTALVLGMGTHAALTYPGLASHDAAHMIETFFRGTTDNWRSPLVTILYGTLTQLDIGLYPLLAWEYLILLGATILLLVRTATLSSVAVCLALTVSPGILLSYTWLTRDTAGAAFTVAAAALLTLPSRIAWLFAWLYLCGAVSARLDLLPATIPMCLLLCLRIRSVGADLPMLRRFAKTSLVLGTMGIVGSLFAAERFINTSLMRTPSLRPIHGLMGCDLARMEFFQPGLFAYAPADVALCKGARATNSEDLVLERENNCIPKYVLSGDALFGVWWTNVTAHPWAYFSARLQVTQRLLFGPTSQLLLPEQTIYQRPAPIGVSMFSTGPKGWRYEVDAFRVQINRVLNSTIVRDVSRVAWVYLGLCTLALWTCYRNAATDPHGVIVALSLSVWIHFATLCMVAPLARDIYLTWIFTGGTIVGIWMAVLTWRMFRRPGRFANSTR